MAEKTSEAQKRASRAWEERNRKKATIDGYRRTAKMFIRSHAKREDLEEFKKMIENREKMIENKEKLLDLKSQLTFDRLDSSYYDNATDTQELLFRLDDGRMILIRGIEAEGAKTDEFFWDDEENLKKAVEEAEEGDIEER